MRVHKSILVGVIGLAALSSMPADAAFAEGRIEPDRVAGSTSNITVSWSDLPANDTLLVSQCVRSDADPVFDQAIDCSQATYQTFLTGPEGKGEGTFGVFAGDEPNQQPWGCGSLSLNAVHPDECFIRLSVGTLTNTSSDQFLPISFGTAPKSNDAIASRVVIAVGAAAALAVCCGLLLRVVRRRAAR